MRQGGQDLWHLWVGTVEGTGGHSPSTLGHGLRSNAAWWGAGHRASLLQKPGKFLRPQLHVARERQGLWQCPSNGCHSDEAPVAGEFRPGSWSLFTQRTSSELFESVVQAQPLVCDRCSVNYFFWNYLESHTKEPGAFSRCLILFGTKSDISYSVDSVLNDFSCFSKIQFTFEGRRLVTVDKIQRVVL